MTEATATDTRWVRLTRGQRDVLAMHGEDASELVLLSIVEQWDAAPNDDGVLRVVIAVGTAVAFLVPVGVVGLAVYLWLFS